MIFCKPDFVQYKKWASEVEAFRKLCLPHPNEAIRIVSGMEVPEGVKINIIENESGVDHTIILPPKLDTLKDEVQDQIAGGNINQSRMQRIYNWRTLRSLSKLPSKISNWI